MPGGPHQPVWQRLMPDTPDRAFQVPFMKKNKNDSQRCPETPENVIPGPLALTNAPSPLHPSSMPLAFALVPPHTAAFPSPHVGLPKSGQKYCLA